MLYSISATISTLKAYSVVPLLKHRKRYGPDNQVCPEA